MTAEIRNDVIVATEHIKAPPEVVFPYFTHPALIVTWIGFLIIRIRAWITGWWERQDDYWENPR